MKRSIYIILTLATIALLGFAISSDAQSDKSAEKQEERLRKQEARREQRARRLAEYERHIDSIVQSRNFRFMPQTMQQLPAGMMRNLTNPTFELTVLGSEVDVCLPFLKGYTPPYYPVVFNYVLTSVQGYNAVKSSEGWHITFHSTMYSSSDYTFTLEIYSKYGGATLTLSSPFYNSVQYTGNILGI
ncbi:MAG: DUF4251 domain-containing protein [Alistipes sp.]|nr:DUF4251 domain-containing protein [Alistipes sp.]